MDAVVYALLNKKLEGKANLVNGKVPASELPSYVDDVEEFSNKDHFPQIGEIGKIYVALDTGFTFRWSGSEYIQIGGQDLSEFATKNLVCDEYDSTSKYFVGYYCIYNNTLYRCSANTGYPAGDFDSTKWTEVKITNEMFNRYSNQRIYGNNSFEGNNTHNGNETFINIGIYGVINKSVINGYGFTLPSNEGLTSNKTLATLDDVDMARLPIFNSVEGGSNRQTDVYYQSLIFIPFPNNNVGDSVNVDLNLYLDGTYNSYSSIIWVDSVWSTSGGEVNANTPVLDNATILANLNKWTNVSFTATVRNFPVLRRNSQYTIMDTSSCGNGIYIMIINKSPHACLFSSNAKPVEQINLENSGKDSIKLKYTGEIDSTHFENANTGESSVVLGEANSNSGTRALLSGKMNRNSGSNNIIAGLGNGRGIGATPDIGEITGNNNIIAGQENANVNAFSSIVGGTKNNNQGSFSIISGVNNVNYYDRSLIVGTYNRNYTNNAIVAGQYNAPRTKGYLIVGNGTADDARSNAFEVLADGTTNVNGSFKVGLLSINSDYTNNIVSGVSNGVSSTTTNSFIIGEGNSVRDNLNNSIVAGTGLLSDGVSNGTPKFIFGYYNVSFPNAILEIGNGEKGVAINRRSNAFAVYKDGTATVGLMGSFDNSVATKKYVDDSNKATTEYVELLIPAYNTLDGGNNGQGDIYYQSIMFVPTPRLNVDTKADVEFDIYIDGTFNEYSKVYIVQDVWTTSGGESKNPIDITSLVLNGETGWHHVTISGLVKNFQALRLNTQYPIIDTSSYGDGIYILTQNKSAHAFKFANVSHFISPEGHNGSVLIVDDSGKWAFTQ